MGCNSVAFDADAFDNDLTHRTLKDVRAGYEVEIPKYDTVNCARLVFLEYFYTWFLRFSFLAHGYA